MIISFNEVESRNKTYLRLRSGDAQRTAMLGICGTKRIAIITWFFQRRDNESRWLSDDVFFGGAELRSNDARLSLTGLLQNKMGKNQIMSNIQQKKWNFLGVEMYLRRIDYIE